MDTDTEALKKKIAAIIEEYKEDSSSAEIAALVIEIEEISDALYYQTQEEDD